MLASHPTPLPTGDAYAEEGDALADVLVIARDVARDRRVLAYCRECRQAGACPATCARGRLVAWAERVDGDAA